jgi:uncharacterized protein (TIGR03435 family)
MKSRTGEIPRTWRKLFLTMAGVVILAVPLVVGLLAGTRLWAQSEVIQTPTKQTPSGQSPAPSSSTWVSTSVGALPRFDTISVKRSSGADPLGGLQFQPGGRLVAANIPLRPLVSLAYNLALSQGRGAIIGAPDWFESDRYNIEAKAEGNPPREQMLLMLQSLLAQRFKLVVHHETRQAPTYVLVLSKAGRTGPQLTVHDTECVEPAPGQPPPSPNGAGLCGFWSRRGRSAGTVDLVGEKVTIDMLAERLSQNVGRTVINRTGLSGDFDFNCEFAAVEEPTSQSGVDASADSSLPSTIFTALQEQLGLKLESHNGAVDVLVIDHVEQPSEN